MSPIRQFLLLLTIPLVIASCSPQEPPLPGSPPIRSHTIAAPVDASSTPTRAESPSPVPTLAPIAPRAFTPSPTTDYASLPALRDWILQESDWRVADLSYLPFFSEQGREVAYDRTFELEGICDLDCVRTLWVSEGGSTLTITLARVASQDASARFLAEEYQSFRDEFVNDIVGCEDAYDDSGDTAWLCEVAGEATKTYAVIRGPVLFEAEWHIVTQALDIEFAPGDMERLADVQFRKLDLALGTPIPFPTPTLCAE